MRDNSMKKISQFLLLMVAVSTLAACGESGVGPSKPAATSSVEAAK
jgi:predicted small lipoprotein YifL